MIFKLSIFKRRIFNIMDLVNLNYYFFNFYLFRYGPTTTRTFETNSPPVCCKEILWFLNGVNQQLSFILTSRINEYAPVFESESKEFLWWTWNGFGYSWVINKTPGSHGSDVAVSGFVPEFFCPNEISWGTSGYDFICAEDINTTTSMTTTTTTAVTTTTTSMG